MSSAHHPHHGMGGELDGDPEAHRQPLPRGAGSGKTLLLDTFSGIAGDMTIAALVDLGVPFEVVRDAISPLGLGCSLELRRARAGALGATRFTVRLEGGQPERDYRTIDRMIAGAPLDAAVRELARSIFRCLARAEGEVHRVPMEDVHFHEVGAVDAIVDIVGAAVCFEHLRAEVVCTPLPLGRGFVECRHGVLPLPPPATVSCLLGVPTYDAGIDAELVTPTGAAIAATVARRFLRWPPFEPERIGWGAGTRTLPDRPNALRAVLGRPSPGSEEQGQAGGSHVVLEANVDDMTGELAAHAIDALLRAGALDAWAVPITMKKGRPGLTLAVLAEAAQAGALTEVLLRETSSIGVRRIAAARTARPRRVVRVDTPFGSIPVKISGGPYGPPQIKPEFDTCVEAARSAGVPVREVILAALRGFGDG